MVDLKTDDVKLAGLQAKLCQKKDSIMKYNVIPLVRKEVKKAKTKKKVDDDDEREQEIDPIAEQKCEDIFRFGVCLYEMVTGKSVKAKLTYEKTVQKIKTNQVIPTQARRFILSCLGCTNPSMIDELIDSSFLKIELPPL